MERINAVFKADGPQTADRYSISPWWLEPRTTGPGVHTHPESDVCSVPGGFEPQMPGIVRWFLDHPPDEPATT